MLGGQKGAMTACLAWGFHGNKRLSTIEGRKQILEIKDVSKDDLELGKRL